MDEFVCVRIVQANTMDLTLFQFDYDLTFAVFFMNADRTIYGRYGTRDNNEDAERDITLDGFREAMKGALALHARYPDNKEFLAGKQPVETEFKLPRDYPTLKDRFRDKLDYSGEVAKSCMHCHELRSAEFATYRDAGKPIPDRVLFSFPRPETIGLKFDPKTRATVSAVTPGSPAALAGFEPGDDIMLLDGQAILSVADVQWVLHRAGDTDELETRVRGRKRRTVQLLAGWRQRDDIAWRVTAWELRRRATGGMILESLSEVERQDANIDPDGLALRVKGLGKYGDHGVALRTGFRKDDIIVDYAEMTGNMNETQIMAGIVQRTKPGDSVAISFLRGGKTMSLKLPVK